jgi:Predicted nucleotide-binding protein containing TIR-like domain
LDEGGTDIMTDQPLARRVFFSLTADEHLTPEQNSLKWGIVDRVAALGYTPEIFTPPPERRVRGMASRLGWGFEAVERVMRRCNGHVIIGMPRWRLDEAGGTLFLPTEFCHYEGAVSYGLRLPTVIFADRAILDRVVFDRGMGRFITAIPANSEANWLESEAFKSALEGWHEDMERRRDIFLGYSSGSRGIANQLKRFLEKELGARVLDWHDDFTPGDTILSQVKSAAERSGGGLFLFTKDDALEGGQGKAAPRDNVVFEAGYFANAKGHERVLIILEAGAKMPADLGGYIYASLEDRSNIEPIERRIRSFLVDNF